MIYRVHKSYRKFIGVIGIQTLKYRFIGLPYLELIGIQSYRIYRLTLDLWESRLLGVIGIQSYRIYRSYRIYKSIRIYRKFTLSIKVPIRKKSGNYLMILI